MLRLQQIDRQGLGVEGFHELSALLPERFETGAVAANLAPIQLPHSGECFGDCAAHVFEMKRPVRFGRSLPELAHFDLGVRGGDLLLDLVCWEIGQLAARPLPAAEARKVVVDAAGFAAALGEGDLLAAMAAQASLQEVRVLAIPLVRVGVGVEDVLHPVEGVLVDQRLVAALVLDPGIGDDPDVVLGAQHPGQLAARERSFRALAGRPGAQAPAVQGRLHRVERVCAGGKGGEGPSDVRPSVGVDFHGANLAAIHHLADVEVADLHVPRRPAEPCLAVQALLDLGREVQRVVLRDGGEDAVRQATRRRSVDALGSRHQLGSRLHDVEQHVRVVAAIAGEAVDLVDDDVGGCFAGVQPGKQLLERGPVRVRRRLGGVDELLGDLGFKLSRLAMAVGPLRLDGIALLRKGTADLPLAGDTKVEPGGRLHVGTSFL